MRRKSGVKPPQSKASRHAHTAHLGKPRDRWTHFASCAAKEAAPSAWFTVSDTAGLYWPDHPQTEKYAGATDFYDVHIYDPNPKVRDFGKLLGKPVILGEVGSPAGGFDDMRRNAPVARFYIGHAKECGISAVLMHTPNHQWSKWQSEAPVAP